MLQYIHNRTFGRTYQFNLMNETLYQTAFNFTLISLYLYGTVQQVPARPFFTTNTLLLNIFSPKVKLSGVPISSYILKPEYHPLKKD